MFNKTFYPTPIELIDKMIENVDFTKVDYALEPEAGKGDIVKRINKKIKESPLYKYKQINIDCIEIEQDLRNILIGNGYRVVHDDFLTYHTYQKYDLIIMNPPFNHGVTHLIKAIEMQEESGGAIVCLLNATNLTNPYSQEMQFIARKIEEYKASVEYIPNAFVDAERKTNVTVALIKMRIPRYKKKSYFVEKATLKVGEQYKNKKIRAKYLTDKIDFIDEIIERYNIEIQAGIGLIKEYKSIKPYILESFSKSTPILELKLDDCRTLNVNDYIERVRHKYWKALFSNKKFTGKLTSNLQEEYYNKVDKLCKYEFSFYNIITIRQSMNSQMITSIEDTILKLFEEFSNKYHWYNECSKNIHYFNGWKTNKAWRVNEKVIIPLSGFMSYTYYNTFQKLKDIEKIFNYLDGKITADIKLETVLTEAREKGIRHKIELKFFYVTFYKKGTCHIQFKNKELLDKFNIFGCQRKSWLPPNYAKTHYADMSEEEKAVIDEFQGKESYEKIMNNTDYYIVKSDDLLQLTA